MQDHADQFKPSSDYSLGEEDFGQQNSGHIAGRLVGRRIINSKH